MTIVSLTLDNLISPITPTPRLTHPALFPVHRGGVGGGAGLTVHPSCNLLEVIKLLMVVKTIDRESCIVRTLSKALMRLNENNKDLYLETREHLWTWGLCRPEGRESL